MCEWVCLSVRTHKKFQHKLQHILREINQAELRRQTRLRKLLGQHHAALLTVIPTEFVVVVVCVRVCVFTIA